MQLHLGDLELQWAGCRLGARPWLVRTGGLAAGLKDQIPTRSGHWRGVAGLLRKEFLGVHARSDGLRACCIFAGRSRSVSD